MHKMQLYEAPEAELLDVRFEGNIMSNETTNVFNEEDDDIFGGN